MPKYTLEDYKTFNRTLEIKRIQDDAVSAAILKLDLMGLTPDDNMVECPPPRDCNIHPLRWRAMVRNAFRNGMPQ